MSLFCILTNYQQMPMSFLFSICLTFALFRDSYLCIGKDYFIFTCCQSEGYSTTIRVSHACLATSTVIILPTSYHTSQNTFWWKVLSWGPEGKYSVGGQKMRRCDFIMKDLNKYDMVPDWYCTVHA